MRGNKFEPFQKGAVKVRHGKPGAAGKKGGRKAPLNTEGV